MSRKFKRKLKQFLAAFMAVAMLATTVANTPLVAFAQGGTTTTAELENNLPSTSDEVYEVSCEEMSCEDEALLEEGTEDGSEGESEENTEGNSEENSEENPGEETYAGKEFTEDAGEATFYGLEINAWDMEEGVDFEETALAILEGLDKTYDIITLCDRAIQYGISKDLYNAAVAATDADSKEHEQIRVNFAGEEALADENWCFQNVKTVVDDEATQVPFGGEIYLPGEGETDITFMLDDGCYDFAAMADLVTFSCCANANDDTEIYNAFIATFGEEQKEIGVATTDGTFPFGVYGYYAAWQDDTNSGVDISISGIQNLEESVTYCLGEKVYIGDYSTWMEGEYKSECLSLHPGNVDANAFTEEQVIEILANYDEKSFDEVCIYILDENMVATVDKDVINAVLPYLKDSEGERASVVRINIRNPETESSMDWILVNPGIQTADQTLNASFGISEGVATVSVGEQSLKAGMVNLNITKNKEKDSTFVSEIQDLFGSEWAQLEVTGVETHSYIDGDEWNCWIGIDEVTLLTANTNYEIIPYIYKGDVEVWDDGNKELRISYGLGEEALTEEQILAILAYYNEEYEFDSVYINQPWNEDCVIYKSVADAAADLITDGGVARVVFGFFNEENGRRVEWQLNGVTPDTEQVADQKVSACLTMDEDGENKFPAVIVGEFELYAQNVALYFAFDRNNDAEDMDDEIIAVWPSAGCIIETYNKESEGWYDVNESHVIVEIFEASNLDFDVSYPLIISVYRGEVNEFEDGLWELYIDEARLDDVSDLLDILEYYKIQEMTFERIVIRQSAKEDNIIELGIFDACYDLFSDNANSDLAIIFDYSGENEYVQEVAWEFRNSYCATEDFDANISFTSNGKAGLSVVFNYENVNAENLNVAVALSQDAPMYTDVLVPTFGEALEEGVDEIGGPLVCVDVENYDYIEETGAFYSMNPEDELVHLYMVCLQQWVEAEDLVILPCEYTNISAPLGQEVEIPTIEDAMNTTIRWNSLTEDIVSVDYSETLQRYAVVALKPNKEAYIMATYTVGEEEVRKVYHYTTSVEEKITVPEVPAIYAMPGVDITLADVDLNKAVFADEEHEGSFVWAKPETELKDFKSFKYHYFDAVYTNAEGKTEKVSVCVNIVRIERISFLSLSPDGADCDAALMKDYSMTVGDELLITSQEEYNYWLDRYTESDKIDIVWSTKENLTKVENVHFGNGENIYKYVPETKGKKTFTVNYINKSTKEVLKSDTISIQVYAKQLFSFSGSAFEYENVADENNNMKGTYTFYVEKDNYKLAKKLTFKSADASVLKIDKVTVTEGAGDEDPVVIKVAYTFKKFGKTYITVTAADEKKSKDNFPCERVDYTPKVSQSTVTINTAWSVQYEEVTASFNYLDILYQADTFPGEEITIAEEKYKDKFAVEDGRLYVTDRTLKSGTHKITLQIPYGIDGEDDEKIAAVSIKVKLENKEPKVKVKQTKKINEFFSFDSPEGKGAMTIDYGGYSLMNLLSYSQYNDFDADDWDDFERGELDLVVRSENVEGTSLTKAQKKMEILVVLSSEFGSWADHIYYNVKTENKAPKVNISEDAVTLYTEVDSINGGFFIKDAETGKGLSLNGYTISLVQDKKKNLVYTISDSTKGEYIKAGKNEYSFYTENSNLCILLKEETAQKSTDKLVFRIRKSGWRKAIDVNYTVKVNTALPTLTPDEKTITLNSNEAIYSSQYETIKFAVKNTPIIILSEYAVKGKNEKAQALLDNSILGWKYDVVDSEVSVQLNGKVTPGTYQFTFSGKVAGTVLTAPFTIKIVDKAVDKCIKVKAKGKLDVLRRETTYITMEPKLKDLTGEIKDFWLEGEDATMFEAFYDAEYDQCIVMLKSNNVFGSQEYSYSTKYTYKVKPVYALAGAPGEPQYVIKGTEQKIKPVQGKVKVISDMYEDTLYANRNGSISVNFEALTSGEYANIENVALASYQDDLFWDGYSLSLQKDASQILKASGTYPVKFTVTLSDAAEGSKDVTVTVKVKIVR